MLGGTALEKLMSLKGTVDTNAKSAINDTIRSVASIIELMGFGRNKLNGFRRNTIVKALNPEFRSITSTTFPGDGLLFGGSLGVALKDIEDSNKLCARLARPVA